jgi:predicted transcriptional regulator
MAARFTVGEREKLKALAWDMHKQSMSELNIAVELGVAQSTVHYWLEAVRRDMAKANMGEG